MYIDRVSCTIDEGNDCNPKLLSMSDIMKTGRVQWILIATVYC
jgi:hypothetical protein